jgi:hypothetical protein
VKVIGISAIFALTLIMGCSSHDELPPPDNPFDPGNPDYVSPNLTIISGPALGEIIDNPFVTLVWEGNESATEYLYKFDSLDWSEWTTITTLTFDYLDEGNHRFEIKARSVNGEEQLTSTAIDFEVDAVGGPALMFYPRRQLSLLGEIVTFQILAEEVIDLMASEMYLDYDPTRLEIISIIQGDFFLNQENSIFIYEVNTALGKVQISTTVLDGSLPVVSGTGDLARIQVRLLQAGAAVLEFAGSETFRDQENNDITILEKINGLVEVDW